MPVLFGGKGPQWLLQNKLKNRLTTWDETQTVEKGESILLYSIIKYELNTLLDFIRARGWSVPAIKDDDDYLTITDGDESFRYAVFSAFRKVSK